MKIKTKNRKNNIKNTTYILVLTTIFILFFTGYSLGKSITQVTIKGNTQIANPIIEVESNPKINITDEQQEGTYNFYVRNYKNTGKITDVKIIYTIKSNSLHKKSKFLSILTHLYRSCKFRCACRQIRITQAYVKKLPGNSIIHSTESFCTFNFEHTG